MSIKVVAAAALMAGAALAQAAVPHSSSGSQPTIAGIWQHGPIIVWEPLPFKPSPVQDLKGPLDPAYNLVVFEGDYTNPNLKPWAAEIVKKHTEAARRGENIPTPQELCKPSGVPNVFTLPAPVQILQEPELITILFQRDHQVRRIWLNRPHSSNVKRSAYGETVGHWEGDTLVATTIGQTTDHPVDIFGTPHTEALHVTERFRVINDGRQLEVVFTVDDPNTFHMPWPGRVVYNRSNATGLAEEVCAENNRLPSGPYPIPEDSTPDF